MGQEYDSPNVELKNWVPAQLPHSGKCSGWLHGWSQRALLLFPGNMVWVCGLVSPMEYGRGAGSRLRPNKAVALWGSLSHHVRHQIILLQNPYREGGALRLCEEREAQPSQHPRWDQPFSCPQPGARHASKPPKIVQAQSPSDAEIPNEATKRTAQLSPGPPTQSFKIINWLLFQTTKFGWLVRRH